MSVHYLLDAYNIIKQAPEFADLSFDEGRRAFLKWLNAHAPCGSARNPVTAVFDGKPGMFDDSALGMVKAVFSYDQSADDVIKAAVDRVKDKKNFVVVSDDKGITLYVRKQGAKVLSVLEFTQSLRQVKKGAGAGHSKAKAASKHISMVKMDQINQEMMKIWLKQ